MVRFISQRTIVKQVSFGEFACFENPKSVRAFVLLELEGDSRKTIINNVVATSKDRNALCRYIQSIIAGYTEVADYEFGYPTCPNVLIDPLSCIQLDINGNSLGECVVVLKKHVVLVYDRPPGAAVQLVPSAVLFAASLDLSPYDDPQTSIVQLIADNPHNPRQKLFYIFDFKENHISSNWRNMLSSQKLNAKNRNVSIIKDEAAGSAPAHLLPERPTPAPETSRIGFVSRTGVITSVPKVGPKLNVEPPALSEQAALSIASGEAPKPQKLGPSSGVHPALYTKGSEVLIPGRAGLKGKRSTFTPAQAAAAVVAGTMDQTPHRRGQLLGLARVEPVGLESFSGTADPVSRSRAAAGSVMLPGSGLSGALSGGVVRSRNGSVSSHSSIPPGFRYSSAGGAHGPHSGHGPSCANCGHSPDAAAEGPGVAAIAAAAERGAPQAEIDALVAAAAAIAAEWLPRTPEERALELKSEAERFVYVPPEKRVPYPLPDEVETPEGAFVDQELNVYSDEGQWMGAIRMDEPIEFPDKAGRTLHRIDMPLAIREKLPGPAILASNGRLYDPLTLEKIGILRIGTVIHEYDRDIPEPPGGNKGRSRLVKGATEARKAVEAEVLRLRLEAAERRKGKARDKKAAKLEAMARELEHREWGGYIGEAGAYEGYGDAGAVDAWLGARPQRIPGWAEGATGLPLVPLPPKKPKKATTVRHKAKLPPKREVKIAHLGTGFDIDEEEDRNKAIIPADRYPVKKQGPGLTPDGFDGPRVPGPAFAHGDRPRTTKTVVGEWKKVEVEDLSAETKAAAVAAGLLPATDAAAGAAEEEDEDSELNEGSDEEEHAEVAPAHSRSADGHSSALGDSPLPSDAAAADAAAAATADSSNAGASGIEEDDDDIVAPVAAVVAANAIEVGAAALTVVLADDTDAYANAPAPMDAEADPDATVVAVEGTDTSTAAAAEEGKDEEKKDAEEDSNPAKAAMSFASSWFSSAISKVSSIVPDKKKESETTDKKKEGDAAEKKKEATAETKPSETPAQETSDVSSTAAPAASESSSASVSKSPSASPPAASPAPSPASATASASASASSSKGSKDDTSPPSEVVSVPVLELHSGDTADTADAAPGSSSDNEEDPPVEAPAPSADAVEAAGKEEANDGDDSSSCTIM